MIKKLTICIYTQYIPNFKKTALQMAWNGKIGKYKRLFFISYRLYNNLGIQVLILGEIDLIFHAESI